MAKSVLASILFLLCSSNAAAFSLSMSGESKVATSDALASRRNFLSTSVAAAVVGGTSLLSQPQSSFAATAKEIITTESGIKYAITKEPNDKKPVAPLKGEFNDMS